MDPANCRQKEMDAVPPRRRPPNHISPPPSKPLQGHTKQLSPSRTRKSLKRDRQINRRALANRRFERNRVHRSAVEVLLKFWNELNRRQSNLKTSHPKPLEPRTKSFQIPYSMLFCFFLLIDPPSLSGCDFCVRRGPLQSRVWCRPLLYAKA